MTRSENFVKNQLRVEIAKKLINMNYKAESWVFLNVESETRKFYNRVQKNIQKTFF